ncbi:MAG: hypothetical protein VB012_05800 [Erysipelotrichaceae bacterium]|nr:hypothetical protein [Erysipelotrichaceae bacterium]
MEILKLKVFAVEVYRKQLAEKYLWVIIRNFSIKVINIRSDKPLAVQSENIQLLK